MDDLLADVEMAFAVTGAGTPGWPDPHPDGSPPREEEYSRTLDPDKYRILDARVDAWVAVLAERGLATTVDVEPSWTREVSRVRRVSPTRPGRSVLLVATTLVDGADYGLEIGVQDDGPPHLVASLPVCGCDACDDGSEPLLAGLDSCLLDVVASGVVRARPATT